WAWPLSHAVRSLGPGALTVADCIWLTGGSLRIVVVLATGLLGPWQEAAGGSGEFGIAAACVGKG
ncbi:MAG: hypothetical protein ACKPKO_02365, partial [Candidatus Fonsibacter sp.]